MGDASKLRSLEVAQSYNIAKQITVVVTPEGVTEAGDVICFAARVNENEPWLLLPVATCGALMAASGKETIC